MIRQIFITPIKPGTPDAKPQQRIEAQRGLRDPVPGIVAITVGRALGPCGLDHAVVMTIGREDIRARNACWPAIATSLGNTALTPAVPSPRRWKSDPGRRRPTIAWCRPRVGKRG